MEVKGNQDAALKTTFGLSVDGKTCLTKHFFNHYAKFMHGLDHTSKGGMVTQLTNVWFNKGFTAFAEKFCKLCVICNTHNVAKGIKCPRHLVYRYEATLLITQHHLGPWNVRN